MNGGYDMTTWMRWVLLVAWLATVGWLWSAGALGIANSVILGLASLVLFAMPAAPARRRRSALRYIEMGKQPVGLP